MSKHRVAVPESAGRTGRRWLAGTSTVALAAGLTMVIGVGPAAAVSQTANTQAQLNLFLSDTTTDTVVLGSAISISDGSHLTVSATTPKTLDLSGQALSISGVASGAALDVSGTASLTIEDLAGGGSLTATGGPFSAAIGSGSAQPAGTIAINSGAVTATGGPSAAGIGGALGQPGGAVTISGGFVQATGGTAGAGIGGGGGGAGGTTTVTGGNVLAQGGSLAAGVGGGDAGAGGVVNTSGPAQPASSELVATGGSSGAGIGGGSGASGGTLSMAGGGVTANGGIAGAGVGGGSGGSGGTVSVTSGSLFATGGVDGAGIGGGNGGNGAAVTIGAGGSVTATDGHDGHSSAVGVGTNGAAFGSLSNSGGLVIPAAATLRIPSGTTVHNFNTVVNKGTITADPTNGAGTLQNDGTILNTGTIQNNGDGGAGNVTVSRHNYVIAFDVNGGPSATPAAQRVYAVSLAVVGQSLPVVSPPAGGLFLGWYPAASGGTQVTTTTDLSTVFASGPSATTLFAHYRLAQTITFPTIPDQTFGAVDFNVPATASSGLPVTFGAAPASVCTISGSTVHLTGAGSCTISADQAGNANFLPAPEVLRSFQVKTGVLTVTATGTQVFDDYPTFTPTGSLPPNVTLGGSLTCTGLSGGQEIKPSLSPGSYTIDPTTCGGIALGGSAASNFRLAFGGGTFTVTKAPVVVIVTGSQGFAGSATFVKNVPAPPPNVLVSGSVHCTTVNGGTPISSTLAVGSYSIDPASCSGLSLVGLPAGGYQLSYVGGVFTVKPQPVTVKATGTEGFGGSPTFTPVATLPSGITLSGTLTCTRLTGNIPISPAMGVGTSYIIDATSCSGLSLAGTGAGNYQIAYVNGPFTVTKAHVAISTHTDSLSTASQAHKFTFTTTVTNTDANGPVGGVKVTVTVKINPLYSVSCTANTGANGVAVCTIANGNLFLPPTARAYTATTPASANLLAGTGSGTVGS
jgi:hypothetical protein